jgi:nitroreductase
VELAEALRRRRMVRSYLPDAIDDAVVDRVVDAGRRAPTAGHSQGQSFVVVTGAGTRRAIARLAGEDRYVDRGFEPWISVAPVHVVICTSESAYRDRYRQPDKLGPDAELDWPVPYWWVDAGAALMAVLLAAVDEGLAAGFLGSHSVPGLGSLLAVPDDVKPIGVVTIGHPAPDRRSGSLARGRRPASQVVHRERWNGPGL